MSALTPTRKRRKPTRRRPPAPPPAARPEDLDPFTAIARAFADREQRRYAGAGVRIGSSRVIHSAEPAPWLLGLTLPAPACRAGFSITLGRMSPARGVVSCRRCLSVRKGAREKPVEGQLSLW